MLLFSLKITVYEECIYSMLPCIIFLYNCRCTKCLENAKIYVCAFGALKNVWFFCTARRKRVEMLKCRWCCIPLEKFLRAPMVDVGACYAQILSQQYDGFVSGLILSFHGWFRCNLHTISRDPQTVVDLFKPKAKRRMKQLITMYMSQTDR